MTTVSKAATFKHAWAFAPRFRAGAFGWRSEPSITRIKEAVSEIKAVVKKDRPTMRPWARFG
jgi:hypothetical protein